MGFRQKARGKREEKQVYLTSLGNAIDIHFSIELIISTSYQNKL
ncbi:hypothetical protein MiTs_02720 [Microcystis aeruginosa NIES-2521]|uniref:Uncharacterized protein n=1 Tax=Microcystis aeruginosa NIES-2521 TaxID=2303983 RepID=A0A5A5S5I2_MICAE|nr:hypothetical protein MiTs_02720 [Microcystis aeruginosa NIES-2521]